MGWFFLYLAVITFVFAVYVNEDARCPKCGGIMLDYDMRMTYCENKECGYAERYGKVVGKWADKQHEVEEKSTTKN